MSFAGVLALLAPILSPLLLGDWNNQAKPYLQKLVDGIVQPDEKLVAQQFLNALDAIAQQEIPKL